MEAGMPTARKNPSITVLLSVHNGMPYLPAAVESILGQTHRDFEFLIVDDASGDGTADYLATLKDERVRVLKLPSNIGLTAALNHGLRAAGGEFVARQDADDLSRPERFAQQKAFLDAHPSCVAVGAQAELIHESGRVLSPKPYPVSDPAIRFAHLFDNALAHTAVMFRKDVVLAAGGYDETWTASQDYELWSRVTEHGTLENLSETLVALRVRAGSITQTHRRSDLIRRVQSEHHERILGETANERDLDLIGMLRTQVPPGELRDFSALVDRCVKRFEERNPGTTQGPAFRQMLAGLHARVGYNLLTVKRSAACRALCRALRIFPGTFRSLPWTRMMGLFVLGPRARGLYQKLVRRPGN